MTAHIQSKIDPLTPQGPSRSTFEFTAGLALSRTRHRGFDIEFDNGYSISVVWHDSSDSKKSHDGKASAVEIQISCGDHRLKSVEHSYAGIGGPVGYIPIDQLVEIMCEIKNLPAPPSVPTVEESLAEMLMIISRTTLQYSEDDKAVIERAKAALGELADGGDA